MLWCLALIHDLALHWGLLLNWHTTLNHGLDRRLWLLINTHILRLSILRLSVLLALWHVSRLPILVRCLGVRRVGALINWLCLAYLMDEWLILSVASNHFNFAFSFFGRSLLDEGI